MDVMLNYLIKILTDVLTTPEDEIVYLPEDEIVYKDCE